MTPRVRVLLVEDQTLVREELVSLLSFAKDLEVAGQAADGDEALEEIERLRPDVVLLDIRLPKRNGLEVLQEAGRRGALRPTIILTTFDDDALLFDALKAGARGFLLKDVTFERLTARERDVLRLFSAGLSNREIGDALGVVEGTVKNYVHSILQKLGVRDRSRAMLKGIELGYF